VNTRQYVALFGGLYILFFAVWVLLIPPDPNDCTAHYSPYYSIKRIAVVCVWVWFIGWLHARQGKSWRWRAFALGTLMPIVGVGFLVILVWSLDGLPSVPELVRPAVTLSSYAILSGLFSATASSSVGALFAGGVSLVLQLGVDFLAHVWWYCIY